MSRAAPPCEIAECARSTSGFSCVIMCEEADAKTAEARVLMDKGSYDSAIELFATALELR